MTMAARVDRSAPKYQLRISSLRIFNCLGCEDVQLKFSTENVHFLLYKLAKNVDNRSATEIARTPVVHALKLLCTTKYATTASLHDLPLFKLGQGHIEMTFEIERIGPDQESDSDDELDMEPCTSQQAKARELERLQRKQERGRRGRYRHRNPSMKILVMRSFKMAFDLEVVFYQVNDGAVQRLPIDKFHKRFFVPTQHSLDHLLNMHRSLAGDFLKLIHSDADAYKEFKTDSNPFDKFIDLLLRSNLGDAELLNKLTTNCLVAIEASRRMERRFVLKVFAEVHRIFVFITAEEYTVMFYVPRLDTYQSLNEVTVDDFDLRNVRTHIKISHIDDDILWNQADHNIMDILLISFQLALAHIANQSVLFLGQLDKLNEFVCHQYATAFFMNTAYGRAPNAPKWLCVRYLERILQLGKSMGIIIFLEYPSGLTLLPADHMVVKCKQYLNKETNQICWQIFQDLTTDLNTIPPELHEMINQRNT